MSLRKTNIRLSFEAKEKLISGLCLGGSFVIDIFLSNPLSKHLNTPYKEIINGYWHDVAMPFGMYFFNGLIGLPFPKWVKASYLFLGCSAMEVAQGLDLYPGTFDPKDFAAYAIGVGLAIGIDKLTFRKKLDNLVEE